MGEPTPLAEPLNLQGQGGAQSEGQQVSEPAARVEESKPRGVLERLRSAQKKLADARESLIAVEDESGIALSGILGDAESILGPADEIFKHVNPGETRVGTRFETTTQAPIPIKDVILYTTRDAKVIATDNYGSSDGVFVGADGQNIKATRNFSFVTYEAADPNDKGAVEAALDDSEKSKQYPEAMWYIQDPKDPSLRLAVESRYPRRFEVVKLDGSGERREASVRVSHLRGKNRAEIEFTEGSEEVIGDPFEVAKRTLDFMKTATLKPAISITPTLGTVPTPQSAPTTT